jgi:hypothetical protein
MVVRAGSRAGSLVLLDSNGQSTDNKKPAEAGFFDCKLRITS